MVRESSTEAIYKRNVIYANKLAFYVFVVLNIIFALNVAYYFITNMNGEDLTNTGSLIACSNFVLRSAACFLIWKYNDKYYERLKYLIFGALLISAVIASFSYLVMLWPIFFIIIAFSTRYCSTEFTAGIGVLSALIAAAQNVVMIPYGLKVGFVNMNFLALTKDAILNIKGGYLGVYNALVESGLIDLKLAYVEAIAEAVAPISLMLGFTVLCAFGSKYNKRIIDEELGTIENIAKERTAQLEKEKALNDRLQAALDKNGAQLAEISALNRELEANKAELEQATSKAEAASDAKRKFLLNMSQDIFMPMNAIVDYTKLIKEHVDDKDKCIGYLNQIDVTSDALLALINDVLTVSSIENGKVKLEETCVDPSTVEPKLVGIFDEIIRGKNIEFTHSCDIHTKYIYADVAKVDEVLLNLLKHAYAYTPSGGRIAFKVRELPSEKDGYTYMQTTIVDTGIGMSQEDVEVLFDEFSGEASAPVNKIKGTGLEMAIVKKLVDILGGTITVASKQDKGTTFVVTLPFRIAEVEEAH